MSMTTTNNEEIRPITLADDAQVAALIRECLKAADLDKPGTVYFDTGLDHLSEFYAAKPNRQYFVAEREGQILGGVGIAEYDPAHKVAELQKFYVHGKLQGHGLGKRLLRHALAYASKSGIDQFISKLTTHWRQQCMCIRSLGSMSCLDH